MHEFVFGLVQAASEGRVEDAVVMANAMIADNENGAVGALLEMAIVGDLLHRSPKFSLQALASMDAADRMAIELHADHLTAGVVAQEILDVLDGMSPAGVPSSAGLDILAKFDQRPGSADVMKYLCQVTHLLVLQMKLQMTVPGMSQRRSPAAMEKFAFDHTRAVMRQEPQPNVFSAEYDDLT